jgi:hypothetical protein
MNLKLFTTIIENIKKQDELHHKFDKLIGEINDSWTMLDLDKYTRNSINDVLKSEYGESGYDLIGWWLYEVDGKRIKPHIYDGDNSKKVIANLETVKKLHKYLESEYMSHESNTTPIRITKGFSKNWDSSIGTAYFHDKKLLESLTPDHHFELGFEKKENKYVLKEISLCANNKYARPKI